MISAQYVFLIVKINHRTLTTDPAPVSSRESKRGTVGVFKIPLLFDRESHFRSSSSKAAAAAFVLVQQERRNVDDLQRTLTSAKDKYRNALGSLEAISNEIHRQRKANALPARTPGVGAESYVDGGDGRTELPATSLGEGGPLGFFCLNLGVSIYVDLHGGFIAKTAVAVLATATFDGSDLSLDNLRAS